MHYAEVPTGFKWMVRPGLTDPDAALRVRLRGGARLLGRRGRPGQGRHQRRAALRRAGRGGPRPTVARSWDRLERLARRFGEHATRTWSVRADGAGRPGPDRGGHGRLAGRPARRRRPSTPVAADHRPGRRVGRLPADRRPGRSSSSTARASCVRPSGTEPKLKVYVEVVEPVADGPDGYAAARADGARRVDALIDAVAALLGVDAPDLSGQPTPVRPPSGWRRLARVSGGSSGRAGRQAAGVSACRGWVAGWAARVVSVGRAAGYLAFIGGGHQWNSRVEFPRFSGHPGCGDGDHAAVGCGRSCA